VMHIRKLTQPKFELSLSLEGRWVLFLQPKWHN
jgi:hypothetical protein